MVGCGTATIHNYNYSIEPHDYCSHYGYPPPLDDVPNIPSPSNVQLSFLNISSVLISWSYPGADRAYFVVQRSYDGDAYKNVSGPLTATQFVYSGMKFSAYYQFRVIAYVGGEASPPTETGYFVNGITGELKLCGEGEHQFLGFGILFLRSDQSSHDARKTF